MISNSIISLKDVGVRYKRPGNIFRRRSYYQAISSANLDIHQGETLGILGRNGAGKSTLLRVISGVIRPDRGKVINRGASVSLLALQAGFDPNLSGRDNAVLSGILHGHRRTATEARLQEIMEFSELGEFFYQPVRTYSSGMRARLGFSISLIVNPDVLLVDEVLSVGDKHFKEKAERAMLAKIQSEQTVVLVSHSHHQIAKLCDRAIIIHNGITSESDHPKSIIRVYEELLENTG